MRHALACATIALAGCADGTVVPPAEVVVLPRTPRAPIADFVAGSQVAPIPAP